MPFAPHMRMTVLGRCGSSGERWAWGVNFADPTVTSALGIDYTANAAVFQDLAADVKTFHENAFLGLSFEAKLESVKFATIGPDGKYTADPFIVDVVDTNGAASTVVPAQLAMAVSLTTARRGPTGKGRFYLPMPGIAVTAGSLTWSDAYRDQAQTACGEFLNNLNNAPGIDVLNLQVVVASTKGYNTAVTGVRVGRVPDTIRSRRRGLPEAFDSPTPVS